MQYSGANAYSLLALEDGESSTVENTDVCTVQVIWCLTSWTIGNVYNETSITRLERLPQNQYCKLCEIAK